MFLIQLGSISKHLGKCFEKKMCLLLLSIEALQNSKNSFEEQSNKN